LADYKGLTITRPYVIEYMSQFDDGTPTSPGIFADEE